MQKYFSTFRLPIAVACVAMCAVGLWGGTSGFLTAALLVVLEVTLSFDNAVVNAQVLKKMSHVWRQRFLTWGILSAVVCTRALLPILIVAASALVSPVTIAATAINNPTEYAHLLEGSRAVINAFGGFFLLLVGLRYFFDTAKETHWLHSIESRLARWGRIEAIEIAITLAVLLITAALVSADQVHILFAGLIGILSCVVVQGVAGAVSGEENNAAPAAGAALFLYLNILDAAFSLDSVVGAFALTTQLVVIIAGLGVGAYFVRALTVFMVDEGTLDSLIYIEHGAHWAIIGLAGAMIASLFVHVPEPFTGLIGLSFVGLAFVSSLRRKQAA